MVRTQIQLPDELHARLKAEAQRREMSLAEVIRRASEDYLSVPRPKAADPNWKFPTLDLGELLITDPDKLRELANPEPEV